MNVIPGFVSRVMRRELEGDTGVGCWCYNSNYLCYGQHLGKKLLGARHDGNYARNGSKESRGGRLRESLPSSVGIEVLY